MSTELVPALLSLGAPLDVIALGGSARVAAAGLRTCAEPSHPPTNLGWTLVGLPRAARRAAVDLIHAPAYTAPLSCRRARRPDDPRRQLRATPRVVSLSP